MKCLNMIFYLIAFQLYMVSIYTFIPGVKEIVEKYCIDSPVVTIDAIVKTPKGIIYAFSEDNFVRIDSISANGLPIVNKESPNMIKKFWGKVQNYIDTGFVFNKYVYFLKNRKLWKYNPRKTSGQRVTQIDFEKEFIFFKAKSLQSYDNILSISTEPNSLNESQSIFLITFSETKESVTFIKVIVIEGNSTKEIEKPTKILLDSSNIDLLYAEQLVTNHWEIDGQTVIKSMRFLNKIYLNLIYSQKTRPLKANEFDKSVRFHNFGYNQIWFGCPQPMCLDSTVDTIIIFNDKPSYAFRGRFYWEISPESPPLSSRAKLIADDWEGLPSYLDASYYDNDINEIYFFKNEFLYTKIDKKWVPKFINQIFPGIPTPIDAVFFVDRKERLFFFKDKSYYIFEVQTNEVSIRGKITEFSGLPNYIDEVVVLNNVVLVFKNWYFYQIDIENFKGALQRTLAVSTPEPIQIFTTLFYCSEEIYQNTESNNLIEYIERYKLYTKPISALNDNLINDQNFDYKTTTTTVETEQSTVSKTITQTTSKSTANGEKESDNKSDNISQNWTFYVIIMTVIMAMIVVLIIGFTIFGTNNTTDKNKNEKKKLKAKEPDEKKRKPKSKSPTNEKSLSKTKSPTNEKILSKTKSSTNEKSLLKTKSPTKDKTDITPIALLKTKNINKEPKIDFTKDFTVSFDDIKDGDDSDDNNEYVAQKLVPRVATEPFLVSKNLSLEPQDKPIHTNLFTRVTRSSEVSRTKSPTNKI